MSHLGERIADYVLGELTGAEKATAEAHVRGCAECTGKVEAFQRTFTLLRSVPEVDPPQRIVFETEKRRSTPWFRRWLVPVGSAAAASLLTAFLLAPNSTAPSAPDTAQVQPTAVDDQAGVQDVISQVQESCSQWLATQPEKRDGQQNLEIQRVCSELAYWESQQRAASRESFDTARSLQLLVAQRLPSEN